MLRLHTTGRKLPALILPPLLLAIGVVVPLLDRDLYDRGPVLEAEHSPSACVVAHDHTICTQVGASRWAPAKPAVPWLSFRRQTPPPSSESRIQLRSLRKGSRHPRAPPLV